MSTKANPEGMKWPTDKPRYDRNWIKLFGKKCPVCGDMARGIPSKYGGWIRCPKCKGLGKVEK